MMPIFLRMRLFLFIVFLLYNTNSCHHHPKKTSINTIKKLSFSPINGKAFRLSELKDLKALVIIMRERDCPISEKYGSRLAILEESYSKKDVLFIFNYVGQVRADQNAKKDIEKNNFKSPYIIDKNQKILNTLGAKTTGDVFVLNSKLKTVYRGPLDDQFHLLKSAVKAKNHYVKDVLGKLLSGKKVIPKELPAPGCIISKPLLKKIYFKDVAPIFNAKCVSCHSGGKTLIEFQDYESIYGRRAMVKHVIENNLMPPWNVSKHTGPWKNDISLSSKEKEIILKWIDEGLPYKNKNIKLFYHSKEEKIKTPDYVIKLDRPVEIPATGFIPWKRLISIPNFSKDKYLKLVEFIIKPTVIHHITIHTVNKNLLPKIEKRLSYQWHGEEHLITGWGLGYNKLQKQIPSVKIPKNSVFIVRIHYEPIGSKLIDTETQIKFKFYSKTPNTLVDKIKVSDNKINIPPYQNNYISEVYYNLKKDKLLSSVSTHMHLRGKSSSISVRDPEGNETEIFRLNPYLFNFQRKFKFKKVRRIPRNHTLICRNYFDNSEENPVNPDSSKNVKFGYSTTDEMSECYFNFIVSNK